MSHKPLKILAKRMFPAFVAEEYPQMITFTEKVFEYMDQEGGQYDVVSNLLEYNDVDTTLVKFEQAFKNQYLKNFPDALAADVSLLVKNIRSFYLNKGTEESFRFLFGALFDATVNFKYPKFNILRVSDGLWYTPQYLVLTDGSDNIPPQLSGGGDYAVSKLIGKFITGTTTGAVAFVEGEVLLSDEGLTYGGSGDVKAISIVEKEGTFIAGEQILIGDTLVENGDFSLGLSFWSVIPEGDSGVDVQSNQLRITQPIGDVQPRYAYQAVTVSESLQYWLRYSLVSATAPETRVTVGYSPGANELYDSGNLGLGPADSTTLIGPIAAGKKTIYVSIHSNQTAIYDGISLIKENTAVTPLLFVANILAESGVMDGTSQWKDLRGMLSEGDKDNDREIVLQDGFYYQDFSYELKSTVSTNLFESIVKDLVHPSGFKMFAEVLPPDDLTTYALRDSSYDDLVFADANPDTITRTTSGKPFDELFRPQDKIRIDGSTYNDGEYVVDTVTPTTMTLRSGLSIQGGSDAGTWVGISAGMGIMPHFSGALDYTLETAYTFPLVYHDNPHEVDFQTQYGFGTTWSQMEDDREALGIFIGDWESLVIGDFDTKATSRFGFIDSWEIEIT